MKQLTLFVEGSPAKTSASLEKELDYQENDLVCGGNSTGSSMKQNRNGSSSKTCQPFAIADWMKCSGRSLRSGMMRNGIVSPLLPLVRLTDGTECGLCPTPTVNGNHNRKGASATSGDGLATVVKMWPTPQASDCKDRGI